MSWDPGTYLAHAGPRLQPGLDLLGRIHLEQPERVVDLGCGPGNLTLALARRWPDAQVAGIDSSEEMLAAAVEADAAGRVSWMPGDLRSWTAAHRVDVVFSNAALHWVDDHARVLHHWMGQLTSGGVLAVQVPDNFDQPSHTSVAQVVDEGSWASRLRPHLLDAPVLAPHRYHRLVRPFATHVDVWQTTYWHELTGEDPVLEWVSGSLLRPLLPHLADGERGEFLRQVGERLRRAYPADESGTTLFPFRRLFLLATKR